MNGIFILSHQTKLVKKEARKVLGKPLEAVEEKEFLFDMAMTMRA